MSARTVSKKIIFLISVLILFLCANNSYSNIALAEYKSARKAYRDAAPLYITLFPFYGEDEEEEKDFRRRNLLLDIIRRARVFSKRMSRGIPRRKENR